MFIGAKIAPVILMLTLGDKTESKTVSQRAGDVEGTTAATKAAGGTADACIPVVLRFFADQINDAAGIENSVQQRGRAFQHLNAIGGGIHAQPLIAADTVDKYRAVRVDAKAAFDKAVLCATQGITLSHAADEFHRIIDAFNLKVVNDLRRDDADGLRHVTERSGCFTPR
ncbi:hypothetical protein D3C80_930110 [compost metagenome]